MAMLDVLLAVILGRDLFSFYEGDAANAIVSLFQPIIFAIMMCAGDIQSGERALALPVDALRRDRVRGNDPRTDD